jgi:mRNA deadenylase 3'-5' endonuclease subunit Ccr4
MMSALSGVVDMSFFCVVSYNILADSYIRPEWYPNTAPEFLEPSERIARVIDGLLGLSPDIACLQEVEPTVFEHVAAHLESHEYAGSYLQKGKNRPDGCATFFKSARFDEVQSIDLEYADSLAGQDATGHVAQLSVLKQGSRQLVVANTHLRWDPPDTQAFRSVGCAEASELMATCRQLLSVNDGLLVCGDFNAGPKSDVVQVLIKAGLSFTHCHESNRNTSNANGEANTIDYIMHNRALLPTALPLPVIDDLTPLPGPTEPSDHLPVVARFRWRVEAF